MCESVDERTKEVAAYKVISDKVRDESSNNINLKSPGRFPLKITVKPKENSTTYSSSDISSLQFFIRVQDTQAVEHEAYSKYARQDRQRIVECAQRGGDWKALAESLDVKYKTAYGWVRSGEPEGKQRGGYKKSYLNDDQIQVILTQLEGNSELTLKQLKDFIMEQLGIQLTTSTVSNYLGGQLYTIKKCHHRPTTMNSDENKVRRRDYVLSLNQYIQEGKDVI